MILDGECFKEHIDKLCRIVAQTNLHECPFGQNRPSRCIGIKCGSPECIQRIMVESAKDLPTITPCPFCGNIPEVVSSGDDQLIQLQPGNYVVLCNHNEGGCGATGGMRKSVRDAIEVWNERI